VPITTNAKGDRRPTGPTSQGKGSKGQGPNGQCKASINPAAAASLSAANWQRECEKSLTTFRTIGHSGGPFRLSYSSVTLEIARLQHSVRIQSKAMHWSLTGPNRDCMFRRRPSVVRAGPTEAVDSPLHCFQPQALAMERGSCILRDDGHIISPITCFATAWSRQRAVSHEMHAMRGHRLGLRKAHLTTVGEGPNACGFGAAGAPCGRCNPSDARPECRRALRWRAIGRPGPE
jgi:hypothetical protein